MATTSSGSPPAGRGGSRPGAGRPATLVNAKAYKVKLDADSAAELVRLGEGNLSAGIRAAAKALRRLEPVPASSSGLTPPGLPYAAGFVNPAVVHPNRWHGRIPQRDRLHPDFRRLKDNIASTGRNEAPVLLRPAGGAGTYELVYGSRRWRSCAELGIPVFAVVVDLTELELFRTMIRESSSEWSLFELGTSLKRAVDAGLAPTLRRLAATCSLDLSVASVALQAASLPAAVLEAMDWPEHMTAANVRALVAAFTQDPQGVQTKLDALSQQPRMPPAKVVSRLMARTIVG